MVRHLLTAALALMLLAPTPAFAQGLVFETFRQYLDSLRIQGRIPGLAVAVVGEDRVLWESAFGDQDIGRATATRTDTPFHLDGTTQILTAALVLRCVEEGRLSLDATIGQFRPDSPDAAATIREILSHSTGIDGAAQFAYRLDRLDALHDVVSACMDQPLSQTVTALLNRLGMPNSVPGPDAVALQPTNGYNPPVERYQHVMDRLATPYRVDPDGEFIESSYGVTTLTPSAGLITTVQDYAWFDLELKNGFLVSTDTLAIAWQPPVGDGGVPLPHGLGWFVEPYGNEQVVWQFGVSENASSSLVVTVPGRGLTMVALANSDRLTAPFSLAEGGLTQSPFARLFLELFVP